MNPPVALLLASFVGFKRPGTKPKSNHVNDPSELNALMQMFRNA